VATVIPPIKPGTARRLGIRQPQPEPYATSYRRLSDPLDHEITIETVEGRTRTFGADEP
jgi:hypothetical protein